MSTGKRVLTCPNAYGTCYYGFESYHTSKKDAILYNLKSYKSNYFNA